MSLSVSFLRRAPSLRFGSFYFIKLPYKQPTISCCQSFSCPVRNYHTGGQQVHFQPKRYFPLTPWQRLTWGYTSASPARKFNLWFQAAAVATLAYIIYSGIEDVPGTTNHKRLNFVGKPILLFGLPVLLKITTREMTVQELTELERKGIKFVDENDEKVIRMNRILTRLWTSNNFDPSIWKAMVMDTDNRLCCLSDVYKVIIMDAHTLSKTNCDSEIAFQLSRVIANSYIRPEYGPGSLFLAFFLAFPCLFLTRTFRARPLRSTIGFLVAFSISQVYAAIDQMRYFWVTDGHGMFIMARAGFDPRVAIEVVQKETLTPITYMLDKIGGFPPEKTSPLKAKKRVEQLEKQLPEALALVPTESNSIQPVSIEEPLQPASQPANPSPVTSPEPATNPESDMAKEPASDEPSGNIEPTTNTEPASDDSPPKKP